MNNDWQVKFFECSSDAFVVIDWDGIIKYWSPAAESFFEWSRNEAEGEHLANLIIPERDHEAHWAGMRHFHLSGTGPVIRQKLQLTGVTKSGTEIQVELQVTPVLVDSKSHFIGQMRRVRADEKISDQQDENAHDLGEESIESVTADTLQRVCQYTKWAVGHALVVDQSGQRLNSTKIWHSPHLDRESLPACYHQESFLSGQELVGQAWQTGVAQWRDSSPDEKSADIGIQSELAIPILVDEEVAAVLQFLDIHPHTPNRKVERRISRLSRQLILALEKQKWQRERLFLAEIVESSPDAVIGKDLQGRIISWNEGAVQIFGYTEDEAIGESISIILPDGVEDEEQDIREVIISGKRLSSFETVRQHKSGRLLDVSLTISPIRDQHGQLIGSAMIERDITLQKQSMRDTQDREEKLRLLMEASGEAIYGIDTSGLCTFANRACAHTLGYASPEDLLGLDMHKLIHHSLVVGEPYPRERCPIQKTVTDGISTHITNEFLWRQDGTSFPAEYWSSPIRRGSEIVGAVIVFEDATERIQADRTKAELAAIVESSHDAIIGKEIDGTIKSWNHAARLLYGYSAEEAIGQSYTKLLAAPSDTINTGEFKRKHKLGHFIDVGVTESPICNAQGEIIGTASVERDITLRKQRERELEIARRDAEIANQAKSEFLANISHELRTPMNGVLGMLRIALDEDLPKGLRDYLTTARESAETLLILLDDLLDLSRLEAGQFELDPEPFNVRDIIDKAVKTLALKAYEKGLELSVHVDSNVPEWLEGDAMRIRQVVTNLTGNAVKFTDQGDVVIQATGETLPDGQFRFNCTVRDTGIGISEEAQIKIFDPFTQADSSTTRTRAGSGLGLAICKELIEKMEGTIQVTSRIGHGTTFRFDILLDSADTPDYEPDVRQLADQRALVVDDNAFNREILSQLLNDFSMRVESAKNAQQAMRFLNHGNGQESDYVIAIVDSRMPETDGIALVDQLRQRGVDLPVVLMVSPGERLTIEHQADKLQIAALLEKPVSRSDVFDALMTALNGPQLTWEKFEGVRESTTRSLTILVVEDTPANQKVVQAILAKRGHKVELAHNGQEAINKLNLNRYDVVLMDVQMPVMDGLQATTAIRKQESIASVPIIAMTAHARYEDRKRCLSAGMNSYISKPIDADKLIRLVEKYGTGKRSTTAKFVDTLTPAPILTQNDQDAIQIEAALKRMGNDREILKELAIAFAEDSPELQKEILEANANQDFPTLVRAAHSLKGLAGNFEALQLVTIAEKIELAAKANREIPQELADALQVQLQRVINALQALK